MKSKTSKVLAVFLTLCLLLSLYHAIYCIHYPFFASALIESL